MSEGRRKFDWRAHLKVHLAADLFPLLQPDELQALADDIKKNGLQTPIVLWKLWSSDALVLVDGRNRLDALALLGWLSPPRDRFPREAFKKYQHYINNNPIQVSEEAASGYDWFPFQLSCTEDAYALVLSLNVHRRHLTAEQKRYLITKVLKAKPEASNRQIGSQLKADHKTVGAVRSEMEGRGEIPHVENRTDTRGRQQPATKGRGEFPHVEPETESTERPRAAANARDIAAERFDAHLLELMRLTKGQRPQRFTKTAVPQPLLGDLAHFLRELVAVRKLAADIITDDPRASAEQREAIHIAAAVEAR